MKYLHPFHNLLFLYTPGTTCRDIDNFKEEGWNMKYLVQLGVICGAHFGLQMGGSRVGFGLPHPADGQVCPAFRASASWGEDSVAPS